MRLARGWEYAMSFMKSCCLAVIEKYLALRGSPADGVALYCIGCDARIEVHNGVWAVAP